RGYPARGGTDLRRGVDAPGAHRATPGCRDIRAAAAPAIARPYLGSLVVARSASMGRSMLPSTICGVVGVTGVIGVTREGTSSSSSSLSVPDNICERLRSLVD